ncbi:MAG: Arc family DNA binding domain-containing protein [Kofleriaceae bacterium]|nr:Arc family DNA binding domain-containing protein [Kofleriaceae bacterium]
MATRKPFLLRLDPAVLTAYEAWASDELRSINGQIEFGLGVAQGKGGRKAKGDATPATKRGDDE